MISSISQYIVSADNLSVMSRSLRNGWCCRSEGGDLDFRVGNSAIVFKIELNDKLYAMKVYCRPKKNLRHIYNKQFMPQELMLLCGNGHTEWSDVVLTEWIEGENMQCFIEQEYGNSVKMGNLSEAFERFAISLLDKEWAHGDLKPENIIINDEGLHLIDFDAMFHPDFSAEDINEIGTRSFQHPLRHTLFDKDIDDYPIALIAVVLRALTLEPSLGDQLQESDYLLINPAAAIEDNDKMLDHIESLFARYGDARHYRLARLLRWKSPALPNLRRLLQENNLCHDTSQTPELAEEGGYWGYQVNGEFVIPPIYDMGFEFSEGVAAVRVGNEWHFINREGEIEIHCGEGCRLKPFRNGVTHITRKDGSQATIYRDGHIVEDN
ncbi:MAG: WG repeat-containing protein [Alistipes sp.]|nr:WG repeat-containing protein [Alistipes sp.]